MTKRLNPETDQPFVRGDVRGDGDRFYQYHLTKPVDPHGHFQETWLDPEVYDRTVAAVSAHRDAYDRQHQAEAAGIPFEEVEERREVVGDVCETCQLSVRVIKGRAKSLVPDADPVRKTLRGLICQHCRTTVRRIDEYNDPQYVERLAAYLR